MIDRELIGVGMMAAALGITVVACSAVRPPRPPEQPTPYELGSYHGAALADSTASVGSEFFEGFFTSLLFGPFAQIAMHDEYPDDHELWVPANRRQSIAEADPEYRIGFQQAYRRHIEREHHVSVAAGVVGAWVLESAALAAWLIWFR